MLRTLRSPLAVAALIALLAAAVYWPVVDCGFVWDDDDYVTQNPVLRTLGGFYCIWFEPRSLPQYYPLVHTTFWLEYRLWGTAPLGYHVVNVVLHAGSAWLLWRLLEQLAIPGALFAALWFLVHPVHVESVAWVTERKNVLSLVCYLAAARSWFCWHDGGTRRHWWIASLWFVAALLSKTVTASLPAALGVVLWWRDGRLTRRALTGALPWLVLGAAFGWFTVHLEATHVGAADAPWQLVGSERLLVAGRAVWFYLGSLLWPFGLCFNYPRWELDVTSLLQWVAPVATLLVVGLALLLHRRLGRAPAAVLLVFIGTLVPALGFFDVFPFRYSFVADHFQYHASLAILVGGSALAVPLVARIGHALGSGLGAMVVVCLAIVAHLQVPQYRDFETLWQATLARNPRSSLALGNLGALANLRGDTAVARDYLERCLQLDPASYEALTNLGVLAHRERDLKKARRHYEAALQWKPDQPNALNNLAVLELDEGRLDEALALAERAVRLDPDYFDGRTTLGNVLVACKHWERALVQLDWVLQRTPGAIESRRHAVTCLLALGRYRPAAGNALLMLSQHPGDAAAQAQVAEALAHVLAGEPPDQVAVQASNACRNGGVDAAPIVPLLERELRRLGATAQADALVAARRGG